MRRQRVAHGIEMPSHNANTLRERRNELGTFLRFSSFSFPRYVDVSVVKII